MPINATDSGSGTRSKRRRHRSPSEDEGPLSGWKMGFVIGVVVLCFGMLYPSLLHPLISSFFSKSPPPQQAIPNRPPMHPSMSSPRTRPDMHPGMRMAATQAETHTTSSSKGMFAWMLPLYTVGVVVFLIYTLVKSKKKKQRRRHFYSSEESDSYDDEENEFEQHDDTVHHIGRKKLKTLQERLKQTELAMNKILEQLGTISTEATQATVPYTPQNSIVDNGDNSHENENNGNVNVVENNNKVNADTTSADKDQYLRDLEKALREFKHLSNSYNKQERRRRGESVSDEEDSDENSDEQIVEDERVDYRKAYENDNSEHKESAASEEEEQQEDVVVVDGKDDRKEEKDNQKKRQHNDANQTETTPLIESNERKSKPYRRSKRT